MNAAPTVHAAPSTAAAGPRGCGQAPPALPGSYLVVELTNRCSLRCVHCSVAEQGHAHHTETGYLDPALFDALLDDLAATGARFDALILFWLGEPLLHPHFTELWRAGLRAATWHGTFGKVEVHTNGTHLSPARAAAALNAAAVPQVWHLSLDAATVETYKKVKGIDRMALVDAQVEGFLRARSARGAPWPRPVLQFIVGENNIQDVDPFISRWMGLARALGAPARLAAGHVPPGDDLVLFFRQKDCATAAEQQRHNALFRAEAQRLGLRLPAEAAAGEAVVAENLRPCSGFWKSPVVSWRGELTSCTRDNLLENQVGDLRAAPFSAQWWGPGQRDRRARVAAGDYAGLPLCQTCFIPRSLNHTELRVEDIAAEATFDAALRAVGR
jgi:hypothetical protein